MFSNHHFVLLPLLILYILYTFDFFLSRQYVSEQHIFYKLIGFLLYFDKNYHFLSSMQINSCKIHERNVLTLIQHQSVDCVCFLLKSFPIVYHFEMSIYLILLKLVKSNYDCFLIYYWLQYVLSLSSLLVRNMKNLMTIVER